MKYKHLLNEINTVILSGGQFKQMISKKFDEKEIKFLDFYLMKNDNIIISLFVDNEPVAVGELQKSPYEKNEYWILYISVSSKFQNKGYASLIAEKIFQFCKDKNAQIKTSSYTHDGFIKLKPLFNKLSKRYNVIFIDTENKT